MFFSKKKCKLKFSNNPSVFTCSHVLDDGKPILYVSHDKNGDWQFLCGGLHKVEDGRLVAWKEIMQIDPALPDVSSIKKGYYAERDSVGSDWQTKKRI